MFTGDRIDTEHVFKLKQEINKLLEERPELRTLQAEIDAELSKAGNTSNRLIVSSAMMLGKLRELTAALQSLKTHVSSDTVCKE
jgi:uncharacterized coiled-coil DUF342 family protein